MEDPCSWSALYHLLQRLVLQGLSQRHLVCGILSSPRPQTRILLEAATILYTHVYNNAYHGELLLGGFFFKKMYISTGIHSH